MSGIEDRMQWQKTHARAVLNANSHDTANSLKSVWMLLPTFAMGNTDRAHYAAIDEGVSSPSSLRKSVTE